VKKDYSMTTRHDSLTLNGGPYPLSMPACPTLFLRKQRHWPVVWETQLDFQPDVSRVEAGTVLYWNHTCYSSIGIALADRNGEPQRIVRLTRPDMEPVEQAISDKGEVKLAIDSTATTYRFGYREVGDGTQQSAEWTWLGEIDTQIMTRPPHIGAPFTGMMMGLYAYGELQPVLAPAHFAYAEFR
jgi:beta-xylosidase